MDAYSLRPCKRDDYTDIPQTYAREGQDYTNVLKWHPPSPNGIILVLAGLWSLQRVADPFHYNYHVNFEDYMENFAAVPLACGYNLALIQ